MPNPIKDQSKILQKLGIEKLNAMQVKAQDAIQDSSEVVLLSPTGTGKTLAFLLPILATLDRNCREVQALIIVPSRELAIQIEQVLREMGTGYKTNAVYGGRAFSKDKIELNHRPAVLIGTPGRLAAHLRRQTFPTTFLTTLVLDEFDKSLEIGFEPEMMDILDDLPHLGKRILTSATQKVEIPEFVGLKKPVVIDFSQDGVPKLLIKSISSPSKDKLEILGQSLCHLGNQPGIVFCNFKDSIERVSEFLDEQGIRHGCYFGGLEQIDRERALIKFRNGTHQLLLATDLAARGIDIPELKFIVHYHLPMKAHEFVHRNGRTARMNAGGTAYVLHWEGEDLPTWVELDGVEEIATAPAPELPPWETLFISGGRKDKISKGDIAGLFFKQAELKSDEVGRIELKQDCAFVAVRREKVDQAIRLTDQSRLKKKKVRVRLV